MSLVLAIFLGIILFTVSTSHDRKTQRLDNETASSIETKQKEAEEFRRKHEDLTLESHAKVIAYSDVCSKEYNDMWRTIKDSVKISNPCPDMVFMTIMAFKGKIPSDAIYFGINMASCTADAARQAERWKEKRKFLIWYNRVLRDTGVEENLMYKRYSDSIANYLSLTSPVNNMPVTIYGSPKEFTGGLLFWMSSHGSSSASGKYMLN